MVIIAAGDRLMLRYLLLLLVITMTLSQPAAALPTNTERLVLGMGCFWGAEKRLSALPGVVHTEVGYAGGSRINPTYHTVIDDAKQAKGAVHAEVVAVDYDPQQVSTEKLLMAFFEDHDPTQGNRQGNDVGANYRSTVYYTRPEQKTAAQAVMASYQKALTQAGYGRITTEILPLAHFYPAEDYHQRYLVKHPDGYCGLGGTGVTFPGEVVPAHAAVAPPLIGQHLASTQLVVFEGVDCSYCRQLEKEVLSHWQSAVPVIKTLSTQAPQGWHLNSPLWASPTTVLFREGREVSRFTGYNGDHQAFWNWLGHLTLTPEQQAIAFHGATEHAFTGSLLDNHAPGTYVDPVTGQPLFRSDTKFGSHTGWPSFFDPVPGALTFHADDSHGMQRTEVLSASSGIHLGHVFNDGPPPTGKRYCINSAVLRFVPDPS